MLLFLQSPTRVYNVSFSVGAYEKKGRFGISEDKKNLILSERGLELFSFSLLPDQFHICIRNTTEGYLPVYMHRVLMAYSKYYNSKYDRSGHVFDGPYRCIHLKNNEQILQTCSYIHRAIGETSEYEHRYDQYLHSSYIDYLNENRWQGLLADHLLLKHYKNKDALRHYTDASQIKGENPLLLF